jgi:hypothetical protein
MEILQQAYDIIMFICLSSSNDFLINLRGVMELSATTSKLLLCEKKIRYLFRKIDFFILKNNCKYKNGLGNAHPALCSAFL